MPRKYTGAYEVKLHLFLTSALDGSERWASGVKPLYPPWQGLPLPVEWNTGGFGEEERLLCQPGMEPWGVQAVAWWL
jgi:hypothetical protein